MKYSLGEIKEKIAEIRADYLQLEKFIKGGKGWSSKNFRSHLLINDLLTHIEDWIVAIETMDTSMIYEWGETEQEILDSFFGVSLSSCVNSEDSFNDDNIEKEKLAIRIYLDIGTPGVYKTFGEGNVFTEIRNVFVDCIEGGNFSAFSDLIGNTDEIMAEQFLEILIANNISIEKMKEFRNGISNITGLSKSKELLEDEERMCEFDFVLISLLEKVVDKANLLGLVKNKDDLIVRDNIKTALFKIELEVSLSKKTVEKTKRTKI